jgi:hypothetical protein
MNYATTTCQYGSPVDFNGDTPAASSTPFAFSSSTCNTEYSTSTFPSVANGFTYGEIVISVLALLIFATVLYAFFWGWTVGHKIKQ